MKKAIRYIILLLLSLIILPASINAQSNITGTVKLGPDGNGFSGVNIIIEGTTYGVVSSTTGDYSIGYSSGSTITLIASAIGYTSIEKTITLEPGVNYMNFWFDPPDLPSDYDDNYYHTVEIGTQTWMVENLKVTHYRDGTNIPNVTDVSAWENLTSGAYCWYDNDFGTYKDTYGAIYNWYAVDNITDLCPAGWHVPTDDEWSTLTDYLGGWEVAGGKLKEENTTNWASPNTGATNETGFTALPGGRVDYMAGFQWIGSYGYYWSSTAQGTYQSWYRRFGYNNDDAFPASSFKFSGHSVRCLKDPTPRQIDSLALVDLYNNTNGPEWTISTNWLEEGQPIDTWYGITVTGDRVTRINLIQNSLTGSISDSIGLLTNLRTLSLSFNQLTGPIPSEIGNLGSLLQLNLSNNQLTGEIPDEIFNLTNLNDLLLGQNQFTGSISPSISNLLDLWVLDLSDNLLSGPIPDEFGTLTSLESIDLSNNQFTGSFPENVSTFQALGELRISNNQFTSFPDLSSIPQLAELQIEGNNLTFRDIEPNIGVPVTTFTYSPQADITAEKDTILYLASEMILSVSTGGDYSQYQWYKDGSPVGAVSADSTLSFNPVNLDDAGLYACVVTNTLATELTLSSDAVTLEVIPAILVYNTDDSGPGSLRNAILYANSNTGADSILFNIPGEGPHTIQPGSLLPSINEPLIIDGYTQPGAINNSNPPGQGLNTVLMIEIDGTNAGTPATGLIIIAGNSTVRGLAINRFSNRGIALWENDGNIIEGNFFGTDIDGSNNAGFGIGVFGIEIWQSDNNIIKGNIVSGNGGIEPNPGIVLNGGSAGNQITGNFIGTDRSGINTLKNSGSAINIEGSPGNIIGGPNPEDRNIIFGGIALWGQGTVQSKITGNYFGVDVSGNSALGDAGGISLYDQTSENEIGPGNVISGIQSGNPIVLGSGTSKNRVFGNIIGLGADGTFAIPNNSTGIVIFDSPDNTIGGFTTEEKNVISGSINDQGISISGASSTGNQVLGNYIGTDASGNNSIGNAAGGVIINFGASDNTIGPGNLISGNNEYGIHVGDPNTSGNKIIGNLIGTTADGMTGLGNTAHGVWMNASNNIIGGTTEEERNVISDNGYVGVEIGSENVTGNVIKGNYLGTDKTGNGSLLNGAGDLSLNNSSFSIVGGLEDGARNVIGSMGIGNEGAHDNQVIGNYIGLRADGTGAINSQVVRSGILISDASDNVIGPGNVISGVEEGIWITEYFGVPEVETTNNRIIGNLIGTNASCTDNVYNNIGIHIEDVHGIIVGGQNESDRNIISGNGTGINIEKSNTTNNYILGNYIGIDKSGQSPIPNGTGINIGQDANENYIGGSTYGSGNLIACNTSIGISIGGDSNFVRGNEIHSHNGSGSDGILITGNHNFIGGPEPGERNYFHNNNSGIRTFFDADYNTIENNYLGTDKKGLIDQTDGRSGVALSSSYNVVRNNLISGYQDPDVGGHGIYIQRWNELYSVPTGNILESNIIGMDATLSKAIPNQHGITLNTAMNTSILKNVIAGNEGYGISIGNQFGAPSVGNLISQNVIYNNLNIGIDLGNIYLDDVTPNDPGDADEGSNNLQNFPILESISFSPGVVNIDGNLNSMANGTYTLEFFASKVADDSDYGEGQTYLGSDSVFTNSEGDASFTFTYPIKSTAGQVITATATDPEGNTSEFSRAIGGVKDHILADINRPFYYHINEDGLPTVFDDSDMDAIRNAFQAWNDVSDADFEFIDAGTTTAQNASATDSLNIVTFRDEEFLFAPGVLAVTAKTLKIDPTGDVAEILDADIVFNPDYINGNDWYFGIAESEYDTTFFDVESVTIHEIGHVLGLRHTGAPLSTMFFMISPGTDLRSLEKDDIAWAGFRYPHATFYENYATISGNITYGDIGDVSDPYNPETHPVVAGALVLAVNSVTKEQIHAYSDAYGNYCVPVPVEPGTTESYWILIQPLDGDVFGFPLRPGNISSYIYSNTIYTDYPDEWYNGQHEGATDNVDDVTKGTEIIVSAGDSITGINLITNKDDKGPYVVDVIPSATQYNDTVNITSDIIIRFSEPVEINTFTEESCFITWDNGSYGGDYWYFYEDSTHMIGYSPERPLLYDTEYSVHLTEDITDLKQNPLELTNEIITSFKTKPADELPPAIEDIIPEPEADSVFVMSRIKVRFSEPMDHTITNDGLRLSSADIPEIEGDYSWSSDNLILTLTPLRYLLEGTEYTVSMLTNLVDISGNAIEKDSTTTFTTVPQANPEVIYIGPLDNATGITVETPVVVDFSEPVNTTTITPQTFKLLRADGSQVSGYLEFLFDDSRVIFRPYDDLDFGQIYTIELTTEIYDISDPALPLAGNISTSFTCASEPQAPYIHYLDPAGGVVGSVVMLNGSGFDPNPQYNKVSFNGSLASVKRSTLSTIAVEVPVGAVSGPVTVEVNGMVSNQMQYNVFLQTDDPCEDITANINAGAKSRDVAVDPEAGLAYVTNSLSGNVSVIGLNLDPPREIETIEVGDYPMNIDIDAMGTYAYVTNYYSHTVSVINLMDYTVRDIVVGENPYGVVVSPDGNVYVANETSENVSVIDVDPLSGGFNHVIANITTGARNREVDISPEALRLLVTGDNGLTIINVDPDDINYNTVEANVNSGARTRDVEITPEGGLAIVTTEDGNIFIVDIYPDSDTYGSVLANITTGARSRDIEISPESGFVYITNEEGSVSVYEINFSVPGSASGCYFGEVTFELHAIISAEEIGAKELEGLTIDYTGEKLYVVNPDYIDGKGQIVEITLCCGPVPPQKGLANMIVNVQNLLNSGYINDGEANALLTKLYNAQKKLDKGQTQAAIKILNAFIDQLNALKNSGSIPESRADAMIYATNAIIYQLEHPPFKGLSIDDENLLNDGEGFLERLYPNPFSEELNIHFNTHTDSGEDIFVDIRIYNLSGQLVKILASMYMPVGNYLLKWDGKNDNGQEGTESVYFINFRAGTTREIRTLIYEK